MSGRETVGHGRYRLERVLGRGGMAEVYLAHDAELGRPVAVKLLGGGGDDGAYRERFAREARLAAGLSHPNVVRVFDAGEDDGRRYIVMEYVEGESLAELLQRRGAMPVGEAVGLVQEACAGLEAAHQAGLVHRDVKPQNLLIRNDGVLKIADFGIAWAAESTRLTEHGALLGTAAYVAPEQVAGEEVTPAADVYSLGAVLYETLTRRTPFEFDSLAELAARQREGRIVPVRDLEPAVPAAVEAVVMRALARDPRHRPQSAAELAAELVAAFAPTAAPTEPLEARQRPQARDRLSLARRWILLAAVLVLVAAAVVLGVTLTRGGEETRPRQPVERGVQPVPPAADAEGQARNLANWIRRYSR